MIRSAHEIPAETNRGFGFRTKKRSTFLFWFCFSALNVLLFLPLFVLNWETSTFLPSVAPPWQRPSATLSGLFLARENPDVFRLNLEFCLFVAVWMVFPAVRRRWIRILFTVLYLFTLVYYIYESISLSVFFDEPAVYSHYFLFKDGGKFLAEHLRLSPAFYLLGTAAILGAAILVSLLVSTMLSVPRRDKPGSISTVAVLLSASVVLVAAFYYRAELANPQMVVSSISFKIVRNIEMSLSLHNEITAFDDGHIQAAYDYSHVALDRQPNIFLIFVESYGSVLYKRPDFRVKYENFMGDLDARLRGEGWHTATALSESTTWGGGSWLSYTSTLFGLRIESHPQYLALVNLYRHVGHSYPSLGRYLGSQGYEFAWVSSISSNLDDRTWDDYTNFYGVDRWLLQRDLGYVGPYYGWGPAPPDQYVLNYARQELGAGLKQPLFAFFITQNSHFPWVTPEIATDWRELNSVHQAEPTNATLTSVSHQALRQNYLDAIEYELTLLTEFVMDHEAGDAVFVFIGDHQPPRVSRRSDGLSTPIHIISTDRELIRAFEGRGFGSGLTVDTLDPTMRHEGFYSLFVGTLAEQYGSDTARVPDYLPNGATVPRLTMEQGN